MLVTLKEILTLAQKKQIGIGAFNTPDFEAVDAVIRAAETLHLPVIIEHAEVHFPYMPLEKIGPIMVDCAKRAKVPVCVHLDHGSSFENAVKAASLGFTSVMFDGSTLPYEENVAKTAQVVKAMHAADVSVEAELGSMSAAAAPGGDDLYTNPDQAGDFVRRTGVDALAISFGTAHGIYVKTPVLNFDIIAAVSARTGGIPLVMHGGSGVSEADYVQAIKLGIRKINYYSYMGAAAYEAAAKYIREQANGQFFHELAQVATEIMYEYALRAMQVFSGKA